MKKQIPQKKKSYVVRAAKLTEVEFLTPPEFLKKMNEDSQGEQIFKHAVDAIYKTPLNKVHPKAIVIDFKNKMVDNSEEVGVTMVS